MSSPLVEAGRRQGAGAGSARGVLAAALLLPFVCSTISYGEEHRIRFEHLTTSDGLSQMTVYAILQDRRGFMWFGTQSGLNRYDGYGFKVYTHRAREAGSLSHGFVRVLHEDVAGALWVGTYGGGLNRFDPESEEVTRYQHDPEDTASLSNDDIRALASDSDGTLWVGTRGGGLCRLDPASGIFHRYRHDPGDAGSLPHDDIRSLHLDSQGRLWIGTYGGGLSRWEPSSGTFVNRRIAPGSPPGGDADQVRALLEDAAGDLWIGTNGGLYRLARERDELIRHRDEPGDPRGPGGRRIRALFEDASGNLWIGTRGSGLARLDRSSGLFSHYLHDPDDPLSLSHDDVYAIFEDSAGGMWVGTFDGGVNRFTPSLETFAHYENDPTDPTSLGDNDVNAIQEDPSGALWIGTFGGGLDRFDPATGTFRHYRHDPEDPASLSHDDIRTVHADPSGILWIGTLRGGLNRFDPEEETFTRYRHDPADPGSLSHDDVYALHMDHSGFLWVGTYGGGLNRLDPESGRFTRFLHDPADPTSLGGNDIGAVFEDRSGVLWVATRGGRLSRFDRSTQSFVHYRQATDDPSSLSHSDVSCLFEDRAGNLWIGTYGGGLDRLDPQRRSFTHFTTGDLQAGTVQAILEDRRGRLWVSTNRGLIRFDPAAGTWAGHDRRDGLQDDQFNLGAALRSSTGRMYFGGIGGLTAFDPERFEDNPFVPPIVLTSFRLFDEERPLPPSGGALRLGHDENFFSFEFAALSFHRPERNRYRYRLDGFDEVWIDPGTRRFASYTNVPAGQYVFHVVGSNNDGVWNDEGVSVPITISTPWWRTGWFRALAIAAAAALLLATYRAVAVRSRRLEQERAERLRAAERERLIADLEEKNKELERFTYAVSHDLKSPLVTIRGFVRHLERDVSAGDAERVSRDLELIDQAADQIQQLVDELLALSRVGYHVTSAEWVPMCELAQQAANLVAARIADRGVEVEIATDLPSVRGDRGRLLEVLQNLLDNAVKYMGDQPRPRVEVGGRSDGAQIVFWVRDNGAGIDARDHERVFGLFERLGAEDEGTGLGLALVRRIVEAHGGRIWVESAGCGHGSTFCFTLGSARPSSWARPAGG